MERTAVEDEALVIRQDESGNNLNESEVQEESRIEKDDNEVSLEDLKDEEDKDMQFSNIDKLQKSNYNIFDKFDEDNMSDSKKLYLKTEFEIEQEKNRKSFSGKLRKLNLKIKSLALKIYSNFKFQFLINFITVYVLFADYFRVIFFDNRADMVFDVLTIFCIFVFVIELLVYLIADSKYVMSFYFFLDVISTVFLIFDITTIANTIFYSKNQNSGSEIALRIGKIVRIIRLIRILKLFKSKSPSGGYRNFKKIIDRKTPTNDKPTESKVTKILKESNVKKLIILILSMMIFIPLFDADIYLNSAQYDLKDTAYLANFNFEEGTEAELDTSLDEFRKGLNEYSVKLARFEINETLFFETENIERMRPEEIVSYIENEGEKDSIELIISSRYENKIQGLLDFISTIFVCVIMIFSINSLNKDMSFLVLNPLERMITKIKQVSIDPLKALKKKDDVQENKDEMNETLLIERAINKISELLVLGFGQAGSKIITHFLFDPDKDFDQIIPGEKMHAIFGFCDIRNFTDATEILLEEVMGFVNKIADIVHFSVDKFGGAANKNIGDAFLLVWKLVEDEDDHTNNEDLTLSPFNRQLAELSLLSYIKIIIEINTQPQILEYKTHEGLNERIPGYSVKMGFGLHVGWAIEGAIGSSYKIDASYLSPNVNLASRLEAATKQFSTPILFSGQLFDMFTNKRLIDSCRHIDTVTVKGSLQPLRLYTVDLDEDKLQTKNPVKRYNTRLATIKNNIQETIQHKFGLIAKKIKTIEEYNKKLDQFQISKLKSYEEEGLIDKTLDEPNFQSILGLPRAENDNFKTIFGFGVDAYLQGDWSMAKQFMEKCLSLKENDGPSLVVYNFLKKHGFNKPENWQNCRELTDK